MKSNLLRVTLLLVIYGLFSGLLTVFSQQVAQSNQVKTSAPDKERNFYIAEIQFEGNKIFSNQELLDSMKPHEDSLRGESPDTCSTQQEYNSEMLDRCFYRATFYLKSKGYLRATLGEPKKQETESGLKITVPVTEGVLYRLGNIKIEGATIFTPEQIIAMLNLKTGEIADGGKIGEGLTEILKKAYADKGYIQYEPDVEPDFKPVAEGATEGIVDFVFTITEGQSFAIHSIRFTGNTRTTRLELEHLLLIHKGDNFSQQKFLDSIKNINELGLYELIDADRDVDFRTDEEGASVNITINLREKTSQSD